MVVLTLHSRRSANVLGVGRQIGAFEASIQRLGKAETISYMASIPNGLPIRAEDLAEDLQPTGVSHEIYETVTSPSRRVLLIENAGFVAWPRRQ